MALSSNQQALMTCRAGLGRAGTCRAGAYPTYISTLGVILWSRVYGPATPTWTRLHP